MNLQSVAIFVLLSLSVSVFSDAARAGGWSSIANIKDPYVTEIAQFALTEQEKQSGEKLSLVEVISGKSQVVAGTNYRLVLAAKDESVTKNYEAQVWDKPFAHFRNLTSFKPLS
ncbi:unnamed protein product [Lathyrus sativus]|nr:unnamed protein product [Lathyrus sativus]